MPLSSEDYDLIHNHRAGILKEVRELLQEGADVNAKDSAGETVLTRAICCSHPDVVLEILKRRDNVDVNAVSNSGETALNWACCEGLSDIAIEILKRDGVDVNTKNRDGVTALMAASQQGHTHVVRQLLQHIKVDVNAKRVTDGATALYIASQLGRVEVVYLLLQHNKVDIYVKDKKGSTALDVARLTQRYAVVRYLEAVEHDRESLRDVMTKLRAVPVELSYHYIQSCITDRKLESRPFGTVVVAEDRYLPKKFVVKKIKLSQSFDDIDEEAQKVIQNELSVRSVLSVAAFWDNEQYCPSSSNDNAQFRQILKRCRHPNIIAVYGYNLNANHTQPFLVYEYASRGCLDSFFKDDDTRAVLTAEKRLSIMFELARTVHFLHTGGFEGWKVFHRDIKSANICVAEDFTAQLTECGLAKFVPEDDSDLNRRSFILTGSTEGAVVGTPGYMCPQYVNRKVMGYPCPFIPAYDVYSIGIVMAELILGSLNLDQTRKRNERINVFQRYIKNEETVIIDGWTQLERDVDKCITWNSKSLQLVCEIAVKCMAPSPDDRLRTSDFLPLLSKAINLQAGLHDFEPAGAGDGPPCAVCNLPSAVVMCSGESHALCSRCIEGKLLKGPSHTPGRQLSCLINDCSSPLFQVKDLRQHISPSVYNYCIVAALESKDVGVNHGADEGNKLQTNLAVVVERCLPA
jgi:serine/threonine protein kinase